MRALPSSLPSRHLQHGGFMLEALIGILIFSFGILGLVGLQAQSFRHINDAQYRGEAVYLANSYISEMWTDDPKTLAAKYAASGGAGYDAFRELVKSLPGAELDANKPIVTFAAGPSKTSVVVTVKVSWQLPGESGPHNYETSAVVGLNAP